MSKIAVEDVHVCVVDLLDSRVVLDDLPHLEVVPYLAFNVGLVAHLPDVERALPMDPAVLADMYFLVEGVSFGVVHHKIDEFVEV